MTPANIEARAKALQAEGRLAEAAAAWQELPERGLTVGAAANLGYCLTKIGRLHEAKAWLARARERSAAPLLQSWQLELANAFLTAGDYREGFELWEQRIGLPSLVPDVDLGFPHWRGESLDGRRFLVWVEQGLGDQIMTVRFCAELARRGAHVTVACRPELASLLRSAPGVSGVLPVPLGEPVEVHAQDFWARGFSLPHLLGVTARDIPQPPYLMTPPDARKLRPEARIGLAWRTAAERALPDDVAGELLALGMISLHPEDTGAQDFAETAALIDQLDLVISVDTSVAHLAGAMGRPLWVLLSDAPDWRWASDPSPWYSAARTFRAVEPDGWRGVAEQVRAALASAGGSLHRGAGSRGA